VTSLRLWVVILGLVSAAFGFAAGTWVSAAREPVAPDHGPFAVYERMLIESFDLAPERARLLHPILDNYAKEIEAVKDRHMADYMSAMEPELRQLGLRYRDLIQDRVLPPEQRSRFDGDAFVSNWNPVPARQ
jgi:hypothetical protein